MLYTNDLPSPSSHITPNATEADDIALTAMAMHLKSTIKSSLTVDELKALGMPRLNELKDKLPQRANNSSTPLDEFTGYDINKL